MYFDNIHTHFRWLLRTYLYYSVIMDVDYVVLSQVTIAL